MPKPTKWTYHAGGMLADAIHKPYNLTAAYSHNLSFKRNRKTCRGSTKSFFRKHCKDANNDTSSCFPTARSCFERTPQQILEDKNEYCSLINNLPNYSCLNYRNLTENEKTMGAVLLCRPRKCGQRGDCGSDGYMDDTDETLIDPASAIERKTKSLYIPTSFLLPFCKCFKPGPCNGQRVRRKRKHKHRCQCQYSGYSQPCNQLKCCCHCCVPQNRNQCDCNPDAGSCQCQCQDNSQLPLTCRDGTCNPNATNASCPNPCTCTKNMFKNNNSSHINDNLCEEDDYNWEDANSNASENPGENENLFENKSPKPAPVNSSDPKSVKNYTATPDVDAGDARCKTKRHSTDDWKSQLQFAFNESSYCKDCQCSQNNANGNHFEDCNCHMCQKRRGQCQCCNCPKITDRKKENCRKHWCNSKQQKDCGSDNKSCRTETSTSSTSCQGPNQDSVASILRNVNNTNADVTCVCTGQMDCPCVKCCKKRSYARIKPHHWFSNGLENPLTKYKRLGFPFTDTDVTGGDNNIDNNNERQGNTTDVSNGPGNYDRNDNDLKTKLAQTQFRSKNTNNYGAKDCEGGESNDSASDLPNQVCCCCSNSEEQNETCNIENAELFDYRKYCCPENPCRKSFGLSVNSNLYFNDCKGSCVNPQVCNNCCSCNNYTKPQNLLCCNYIKSESNETDNPCSAPEQSCEQRHICDRYPRFFNRQRQYCYPYCQSSENCDDCRQPSSQDHECPPPVPNNYNTSIYKASYKSPVLGNRKPWLKHKPKVDAETCDLNEPGLFPEVCPTAAYVHPDDEAWENGRPRFRKGRTYGNVGTFADTFKIFSELDDRLAAATSYPSACKICEPACGQRVCNDRDCRMPNHIEFRKQRWPDDLCACCLTKDSNMFTRYCSSCD